MYPPSMIAAGSVSAAANGLLGHEWVQKVCLMDRLQQITGIDMVGSPLSFIFLTLFHLLKYAGCNICHFPRAFGAKSPSNHPLKGKLQVITKGAEEDCLS